MIKITVPLPIYTTSVNLWISMDTKKLSEKLRLHFIDPSLKKSMFDAKIAITFIRDGYEPVICMHQIPQNCFDYATLSHELMHTVFWILKNRGVRLNKGSEEAYTYLMGHLTEEFLNKINKLKCQNLKKSKQKSIRAKKIPSKSKMTKNTEDVISTKYDLAKDSTR